MSGVHQTVWWVPRVYAEKPTSTSKTTPDCPVFIGLFGGIYSGDQRTQEFRVFDMREHRTVRCAPVRLTTSATVTC
jgi:hypothetical protein